MTFHIKINAITWMIIEIVAIYLPHEQVTFTVIQKSAFEEITMFNTHILILNRRDLMFLCHGIGGMWQSERKAFAPG